MYQTVHIMKVCMEDRMKVHRSLHESSHQGLRETLHNDLHVSLYGSLHAKSKPTIACMNVDIEVSTKLYFKWELHYFQS